MKRFVLSGILGLLLLGFTAPAKAQAPIGGQAYLIPAQFAGYAPGSIVNYAGYNYVIQNNGTMLYQGTYSSYYVAPSYTPYYAQPYPTYYYGPGYRRGPGWRPSPWRRPGLGPFGGLGVW